MCLTIDDVEKSNLAVSKLRKSGKPIKAYKVLTSYPDSHSPYLSYIYKEGTNVSNRKSNKLDNDEKKEKYVIYGFHCFVKLTDAKKHCKVREYRKIIGVTINPIDVVAFGSFKIAGDPSYPSLVCKKLKANLSKIFYKTKDTTKLD